MLPGKKYKPIDLMLIAWRWKWLILGSVVLCSFAGLVYSARLPDVYQSDMVIQIVPQRVPDAFVRSTVTLKTEDRIESIFQQAKSRTRLEQIINDLNLYPKERLRLPIQDVVELMQRNVEVEIIKGQRDQPADAFHVRFRYGQADLAAKVTGTLGAIFVNQNTRDREELSRATNDFLQRQLLQARERLEAQEQKLKRFREQHAGSLPTQLEFNMQAMQATQLQLQSLAESVARDRDRKMMLERLYNDAASAPLPIPPAAITTAAAADATGPAMSLQQQVDAARSNLARLQTRLKPAHPDLIRAQRQLAELEQKLKELPPASAATPAAADIPLSATASNEELKRRERLQQMHAEIESLDRQIVYKEKTEGDLRAKVTDYEQRVESVPKGESEWTALTRDYDTISATYKDLLTKSESSKVAADLENQQIGEQFRVLDAARVPGRPISPVRWQISGGAFGLGLLLGLGLTALLELLDSTYRSETDVVEVLGLPVVAVVPYLDLAVDRRSRRLRQWLVTTAVAAMTAAGAVVFWSMQLWKHIV
jgi:polysaccharide chain length determinant protein (PEP-CTERM system associated)